MTYLPIFLALVGAAIANPVPQGVTAAIAPPASAPAGCLPSYSGTFGVAVLKASGGSGTATQGSDGQTNAGNGTPVGQAGDGQTQAQGGVASQIGDGQVQAKPTPIAQIGDGQIQSRPISQIGDGQIQNRPVSQIGDGQVQSGAASQIGDGQVQSGAASQIGDGQVQSGAASQIGDGQVQSGKPVGQAGDGQTQSTGPVSGGMVACQAADSLSLTLNNGILLDNKGRTGYIASNYQFQFDAPAQAGAIYTAGFSVCGNGSLALGGSAQFWQCRSGDFYNLYDRWWAAQCEPVTINVVKLVQC